MLQLAPLGLIVLGIAFPSTGEQVREEGDVEAGAPWQVESWPGDSAAALRVFRFRSRRLTGGAEPCALHIGCAPSGEVLLEGVSVTVAPEVPETSNAVTERPSAAEDTQGGAHTRSHPRQHIWLADPFKWTPPNDADPWHRDVFDDPWVHLPADQYLFKAAPPSEWLVLGVVVLVLVIFDVFILRQWTGSFGHNLGALIIWISAGLAYNIYFYMRFGSRSAIDWCSGYFLEWMLSLDNLFVFHMIFRFYKTPPALMPKALFFGIVGAVVFRMLIFSMLGALMHVMHWIQFLFGLLLVYSGIQAAFEEVGDDEDISSARAVRFTRWLLGSRLQEDYDLPADPGDRASCRLFVRDKRGRLCVTLTVFVILCLEATDLVFAVDSVSAKVAQIPNQYVAYSSSVLALFGLRAMFFLVKDLVDCFELLKYGICIILVFVGVELIVSPFMHLESATVCIVMLSVFVISISASTAKRLLIRKDLGAESSCAAPAGSSCSQPPEERAPADS